MRDAKSALSKGVKSVLSEFDLEKVKELRYQIETDLVFAVTRGFLPVEGLWHEDMPFGIRSGCVYLSYREEHLPELPLAAKLYQQDHPENKVEYLGLNEDGSCVVQVFPSPEWVISIHRWVPTFPFIKVRKDELELKNVGMIK